MTTCWTATKNLRAKWASSAWFIFLLSKQVTTNLWQNETDCKWVFSLDELAVPIAVSHVVDGFWRSVNGRRNSRIPTCSSRKVLKVGSGKVLVTLKALIQGPVWVVEGGVPDPGQHAWPEAGLPGFLKKYWYNVILVEVWPGRGWREGGVKSVILWVFIDFLSQM